MGIIEVISREKIENLKDKIRQMNIEAGALAIRKVSNHPSLALEGWSYPFF